MIKAFFKRIAHFLGYGRPKKGYWDGSTVNWRYPELYPCAICGRNSTYFVPDVELSKKNPYMVWTSYCDFDGPLPWG